MQSVDFTSKAVVNGLSLPFHIVVQIQSCLSPFDFGRILQVSNGLRIQALECIQYHGLNFSNDRYRTNDEVLMKLLTGLGESSKQLKSIDLRTCFNISDEGINTIASSCSRLRSICLGGTIGFPLRHVDDEGIVALAERCPLLQELKITEAYITSIGIKALVSRAPTNSDLDWRIRHFKCLDISNCARIDDEAIKSISHFEGLETLSIGGCRGIARGGLNNYLQNSKSKNSLKTISLQGLFRVLDVENVKTLAQSFGQSVMEIDLSGNRLSDQMVRDFCDGFQEGKLKTLILCRTAISPASLCRLLASCGSKLEKLILGNCKTLAKYGTKVLSGCIANCPRLKHLDLSMIPCDLNCLSDPTSPRLRSLSIMVNRPDPEEQPLPVQKNSSFSDKSVVSAIKNQPDLQLLHIQGSCNLHSATIIQILETCRSIRNLDIGSCLRRAKEGGQLLQHLCQKHLHLSLRHLRLSETSFQFVCSHRDAREVAALVVDYRPTLLADCQVKAVQQVRPHLNVKLFSSDCQ